MRARPPSLAHPIAAAALLVALSTQPALSVGVDTTSPQQQQQQQQGSDTAVSQPTQKQLREQSRNNTRLSGARAQTFATARRTAAAGDLDAALNLYNQLVEQAPNFAPAYSNRANILVARGRYQDARTDYDTSLRLAPLDTDAWVVHVNRGATYLAMGDASAALDDMNVAHELRGDDPTVMSNRAAVYEVLGKWDNAIRDYQKALRSNDVQPFWIRYALALFQRNKSVEALAILKRVAARFPGFNDVHVAMALVYYDRNDFAAAETEWSAVDRPKLFENERFLRDERKWPPRAVETLNNFRNLNPQ
ncbi:UDP-N-acetylglucosamine--peptide N-acetylglucosaminyltransferase [Gracilariopsis chorda]|uniref:UDP-N-acetylglucosamine--peptide N-acetylglucosaminyltransferase n=1 Tax=Gracilariopsis chorda TaxID=448386 RepID=A0A2V3J951_9FLOR|nr:UDP-N-acetylglucosamine--peptide N-acetylglucosaminyltransferase [Gracilariopsis chorda]|eukprot:PXF50137.1 UDP-N-acetylglucosamine--peptide N-acetylglucosaminyltransferase [Gracilariopsis chorda]